MASRWGLRISSRRIRTSKSFSRGASSAMSASPPASTFWSVSLICAATIESVDENSWRNCASETLRALRHRTSRCSQRTLPRAIPSLLEMILSRVESSAAWLLACAGVGHGCLLRSDRYRSSRKRKRAVPWRYRIDQPAGPSIALLAAATACFNKASNPPGPIRISSAAAVVPLGDVTFLRNVAGSSGERCRTRRSLRRFHAPTFRRAPSEDRQRSPASASASAKKENIGRTRSGNSRHRVHQCLILDPFDLAGRGDEVGCDGTLGGCDFCIGNEYRDAAPDRRRRVRHRARMAAPGNAASRKCSAFPATTDRTMFAPPYAARIITSAAIVASLRG